MAELKGQGAPKWGRSVVLASICFSFLSLAQAQQATEPASGGVSPQVIGEEVAAPGGPVFSQSVLGDAGSPVSITDAVLHAVQWHPAVSEAVGGLNREMANIKSARAGYFPQISVGVVAGEESDSDSENYAFQLYASQLIYDFGKVSSDVALATAGRSRAEANLLLTIDEVARDTALAAVEVQRYQQLVFSAQEQVDGVAAISRLVEMRSKRGASSYSDVLQAKSRMEAARASRIQIEADLNQWRSVLQSLTGSPDLFSLSGEFPENASGACDIEGGMEAVSPQLLIAEAERAEAFARMKQSKAQAWPTISIDGSVNRYLSERYVDSDVLDEHESAIFLRVSMPVYQGGRIRSNRDSAGFALRSAEAARDFARLEIDRDLQSARRQATGLDSSLSILSTREESIRQTRDLYRKQYSALGTRTLIDLLNAERELHQARTERQNTLYDLHRLDISCLYTAGRLREAFTIEGREVQGVAIWP